MTIRQFIRLHFMLTLGLLLALVGVSILHLAHSGKLEADHQRRFQSWRLADELRQSSDDLTRFVRTYTVTGDPRFERYFAEILDIRNGIKPLPEHSDRIYWDFVAAKDLVPDLPRRRLLPAESIRQRMQNLGFTDEEFAKLREAQNHSDALVNTERIAMQAMRGRFADERGDYTIEGPIDQQFAMELVHDDNYHLNKAIIMQPIDEFLGMVDSRTATAVRTNEWLNQAFIFAVILLAVGLTALTLFTSHRVGTRLSNPLQNIEQQTLLVAADLKALACIAHECETNGTPAPFIPLSSTTNIAKDDEITHLGNVFNNMVTDLRETGSSIARITTDLKRRTDERTKQAALLEQSNEELDKFAYFASHDLKSPLRAIDNLASWICEDCADLLPEESRNDLQLMRSRVSRMEGLLQSLLEYSRVGRKEGKIEKVDMNEFVRDLFNLLDHPEESNLVIESPLPTLETTKGALNRVFGNLFSNAIKHGRPDGGTIRVACDCSGTMYQFDVADDGPGIPAEDQARVFEMFQTLKRRDELEGQGMGLALVKKTVEKQGGGISLESSCGHGCRFRFTWPRKPSTTAAAGSES